MKQIGFAIKWSERIRPYAKTVLRTAVDWGLTMRAVRPIRAFWILHRNPISDDLWHRVSARQPLLHRMTAAEKIRLRALVTVFLHEKTISGTGDLLLNDSQRLGIAIQACLPALGLGYDCLSGWRKVIVYSDESRLDFAPANGNRKDAPMRLSWSELERDGNNSNPARNAVIHAVARKIESLNGYADGLLPLSSLVDLKQWSALLSSSCRTSAGQEELQALPKTDAIPCEFFAILSEYFFCAPHLLQQQMPDIFRQFQFFYRRFPPVKR